MNYINLTKALLIAILVLIGFAVVAQQQGITQDMLDMLRRQGVNIDGPVPPMDPTSFANSQVTVDFSKSRGKLLRAEKYNNFSHSEAFVETRSADVKFYNEIGLHGEVYRVWLEQDRFYDPTTGKVEFHEMIPYLEDASAVSDFIIVNCGHLGVKTSWKISDEEAADRLAIIFSELKKKFPKVKYIEATNEPDYSNEGFTPDNYYDAYKIFYKAVNKVNAELKPEIPLQVGGPATAQFSLEWMRGFLDSYLVDTASDKRIDFISYHGYFTRPDSAYILFKENPSIVKDQRKILNQELASRGLDTTMPVFITEMGLYPGPSFDDYQTMKFDRLRQAAGMPSLIYWYLEDENTYPFNWVFRHQTEGRKDQLVSRDEKGGAFVYTEKLTPYGNTMLMMSKMKKERVALTTSAEIVEGKGVYTMAAKDETGISLMIWNFQGTKTVGQNVDLNLVNLPKSIQGMKVVIKKYLIDEHTSNYQNGLENANLQLVEEYNEIMQADFTTKVSLNPNSLYLLLIEAKK